MSKVMKLVMMFCVMLFFCGISFAQDEGGGDAGGGGDTGGADIESSAVVEESSISEAVEPSIEPSSVSDEGSGNIESSAVVEESSISEANEPSSVSVEADETTPVAAEQNNAGSYVEETYEEYISETVPGTDIITTGTTKTTGTTYRYKTPRIKGTVKDSTVVVPGAVKTYKTVPATTKSPAVQKVTAPGVSVALPVSVPTVVIVETPQQPVVGKSVIEIKDSRTKPKDTNTKVKDSTTKTKDAVIESKDAAKTQDAAKTIPQKSE